MNKTLLKQKAEALEAILLKYASSDEEAKKVLNGVRPLLQRAKEKTIDSPLEIREVPGGYFFDEGSLRKYRDLEHAYSEFCIEITGGAPSALMKFSERRKKMDEGRGTE